MPRPLFRGLGGEATRDSAASLPSQALRVRPCAAARAWSAAAWSSGISITVMAGLARLRSFQRRAFRRVEQIPAGALQRLQFLLA